MVVDFELNQKPFKVFAGAPGVSKPDRSVNDILISLEYSNGGSNVLAALVCARCEAPLADVFEQRLLAPLGLTDTFALDDDADPRLAHVGGGRRLLGGARVEDGPVA